VGALVYRASTVESLANVSIICFSSSGTLTGQQATLETIPPPPGPDHLSDSRIRQILGDCLHSAPSRQPTWLALAHSFTGQARLLKEVAPFYTAFGWSGFSFELDDCGTYILGDVDLLRPNLTPDRKDGETAEEGKRPAKPAQSGRWNWLARLRRAKSSAEAKAEQSLEATETMAIEETMSMATDWSGSNNGPTSTEDGNTNLAPAETISFRQEWRTRFRRWFTPESLEPETAVSAKTGEEPDGINLLFAYCPDAVPLYDETGFPQLLPELSLPEAIELVIQPGSQSRVFTVVRVGCGGRWRELHSFEGGLDRRRDQPRQVPQWIRLWRFVALQGYRPRVTVGDSTTKFTCV
jgi:hypothetical protein